MKKIFTLICATLMGAVAFAQDAYNPEEHTCVMRGTSNFCTYNWADDENPGDAMTYDAAKGVWFVTKKAAVVNQTVELKVVYDDKWYGVNGGDGNLQFSVSAECDVTVSWNPETMELKAEGANVGDPVTTVEYIVLAGSATLFGSNWDPTDKANEMEAVDDGYYQKTYTAVSAGIYEFKATANGAWAIQWGGNGSLVELGTTFSTGGDNVKFELPEGFTYTVTITLDLMDSTSPKMTVEAKQEGSAEIKEAIYSVAGTMNGWNAQDETTELSKLEEGIYEIALEVPAGDHRFKVVKNHDWTVAYGAGDTFSTGVAQVAGGNDAWFTLTEDATVVFTLNVTNPSEVTILVQPLKGDAIESLTTDGSTAIYNLAGQRVQKATRGLYIIGGRKVLK
ncbi:MAG: hypothetical protein HUK02_03955 [Bacteroidaceae bacterium]|nr:hypothetical protein [Bacteroidaceae bacterium]